MRLNNDDPQNGIMSELQIAQNNVMRTILTLKQSDRISVESLLDQCNWLSVNQMAINSMVLEAWKVIKKDTNCGILEQITKTYKHETRTPSKGHLCPQRKISSDFVMTASRLLKHKAFEFVKYLNSVSDAKHAIV